MRRRLPPLALAYHSLSTVSLADDPFGLCVRFGDLVRQVGRLRSWGYQLVTFGELARYAENGDASGYAALTFDDGFADNLQLLELGIPATVFVVAGWFGSQHPHLPQLRTLAPDEIRLLHAGGIEIGAHTLNHADLTLLSHDEAIGELADSRTRLEAVVDAEVTSLAYPYGHANPTTISAAAQAGFRAACRTSGQGSWEEPLNLPRQDMGNGCTLIGLRLKRDGHYEPLMRHFSARVARRVVRRSRGLRR